MRRLKRKRLSRAAAVTHVVGSNQEWALDFVCDTLATGRGIRVLAPSPGLSPPPLGGKLRAVLL